MGAVVKLEVRALDGHDAVFSIRVRSMSATAVPQDGLRSIGAFLLL